MIGLGFNPLEETADFASIFIAKNYGNDARHIFSGGSISIAVVVAYANADGSDFYYPDKKTVHRRWLNADCFVRNGFLRR